MVINIIVDRSKVQDIIEKYEKEMEDKNDTFKRLMYEMMVTDIKELMNIKE